MSAFIDSHHHAFWGAYDDWSERGDNPDTRHFSLIPHTTTTATPTIDTLISIQGDTLQLSYFISKFVGKRLLALDDFAHLTRADYLWEKNCFECFFDVGQSGYVEMNFTPQGEYNLYRFDDYRTPDVMPPTWADGLVFMVHGMTLDDFYAYHLGIKLDGMPVMNVHNINPTAILYEHGEPIFYAVKHKCPPDFHDKAFWRSLKSHILI